jgi:hypothetical protein
MTMWNKVRELVLKRMSRERWITLRKTQASVKLVVRVVGTNFAIKSFHQSLVLILQDVYPIWRVYKYEIQIKNSKIHINYNQ